MTILLAALTLAAPGDSLGLAEWLDLALANSPEAVRAGAMVLQADATFSESRASLLPRLSLSASTGRSWDPGSGDAPPSSEDGTTASLGLSLTADLLASGGSDWLSLRSADLGREQADLDAEDALLALEHDVASAFHAAVEAAWLVRAAETALDRSEAVLGRVEILAGLGGASTLDLMEARVQETGDRLALLRRRQDLDAAERELRAVAGVPSEERLVADTASVADPPSREAVAALEAMEGSNPALSAAGLAVARAELGVRMAESSWLPSLGAGLSWNWNGAFADLEDAGSDGVLGVSLTLSMPVFDGGLAASRTSSARASLLEAQAALTSLETRTAASLALGRDAMEYALDGLELAELQLEYASGNYELRLLGYGTGGTTLAGLLDAQSGLTEAEAALVSARIACLESELEYRTLVGLGPGV